MKLTALQADIGKRLDVFVTEKNSLNRSSLKKLNDNGKILVNHLVKPSKYKIRLGDEVEINYQPAAIPIIDLPIVYQDDNCLVISKPTGILSHSKGVFNPEATVASFIEPLISGFSGDRGGIVHRLDRATSGVMICARNPETLSWLQKQFSQRKTKKTYYAVVTGTPAEESAIIDLPISRSPRDPKTFKVDKKGKASVTQYKVIESKKGRSLLELTPKTGRTHQLRVHLSHIGHPIVGDKVYGGAEYPRLLLHASQLEITLPGGIRKVFSSPIPSEFQKAIS